MKLTHIVFAAAAIAVSALGSAPARAGGLIYELKAGVLAHDVPDLWSRFRRETEAVDVNIDVQLSPSMQAFCIPTEGDNDADAQTHEVAPKVATPRVVPAVAEQPKPNWAVQVLPWSAVKPCLRPPWPSCSKRPVAVE